MVHKIFNTVAIFLVVIATLYCLIPFYRNFPESITETERMSNGQLFSLSTHLFIMAIAIWVGLYFNYYTHM